MLALVLPFLFCCLEELLGLIFFVSETNIFLSRLPYLLFLLAFYGYLDNIYLTYPVLSTLLLMLYNNTAIYNAIPA